MPATPIRRPGVAYPPEPDDKGWHYAGIDYAASVVDPPLVRFVCAHGHEITITGPGSWSELHLTFQDGCPLDVTTLKRKPPPEDGIALA